MDGARIEFRQDALCEVARQAMSRKTGARGLRSILENVLIDTMYHMPSITGVDRVIVDAGVIRGETKPFLIYNNDQGEEVGQAASK